MPLRKDAFETREELGRELSVATPNRARITELTDRMLRDRREMRSLEEHRMSELRSQLTPEQYARLIVSHEGRGHHGRRMHGVR
jgi:Spy/CpxP family protein refolding chaperone